jgi:hypothetical protein
LESNGLGGTKSATGRRTPTPLAGNVPIVVDSSQER